MIRLRTTAAAMALLTASAMSAEAQVGQNTFQVSAHGGFHAFAGGSAINGGATLGGDATFFISPSIGVGVWSDYTVSDTDGDLFPPTALAFGSDSTTFTTISQPLDIWQYGAHVKFRLPRGGGISPFGMAGIGGVTVFFDPQQNDQVDRRNTTRLAVRFGAGLDLAVTDATGFQVGVYDAFFPSWRPNRLLPTRGSFQNSRFPELNPDPGELDDSVHNFRFVVGFTLIPGSL